MAGIDFTLEHCSIFTCAFPVVPSSYPVGMLRIGDFLSKIVNNQISLSITLETRHKSFTDVEVSSSFNSSRPLLVGKPLDSTSDAGSEDVCWRNNDLKQRKSLFGRPRRIVVYSMLEVVKMVGGCVEEY